MTSIKRKIVRNTIANYTFRFLVIIINLILFPFIVDHIGVVAYGIYALIGSITGYFGLLDLGVSPALVKYIAEYHATGNKRKMNETVNTGFFFFLGMGIISFICFIIVGKFGIQYFNMPYEYESTAQMVMYLTAIGTLFGFPLRGFSGVLHGLQRYDLGAYIGIVSSIVNAVVIVTVLIMGGGLIELVLYSMIFSLIGPILTVCFVVNLLPTLTLSWKLVRKRTVRKVFRFGSVMFIMSICSVIIYQTDQIVIGIFLTVGAITFYVVAAKLHTLVRQVHGLMGSAIMPAASELGALRKRGALKKLLIKGSKYTCAVTLPATICILLMAEPIIRYWMGDSFLSVNVFGRTTSVVLVTQVFVFYWLLNANTGIAGAILVGTDKLRLIMWYAVGGTIANLILSIILVQEYGILGVVLGTTIPYIVGFPIFMWYMLKILRVGKKTYLNKVILKTYPQAGLIAVMLYSLIIFHYPSNLIEVGIYGLFTFGIYILLFYLIGLDTNEKEMVRRQISRITLR